jgi:Domain of unknown function (DUF4340)
MKTKGILIASIVLAGLMGLLYWSDRHPPADKTITATPTPTEPAPQILALKEEDISRVELKKKNGDQVVLAKDDNGKWQITAPKTVGVDDAAVSGMLSAMSALNSERLVEGKTTNPARYGLAQPEIEINVTDKSGSHKLLIGDNTPTGNSAYAQLAGDPRVFTVAGFTKTSFDKGLNDLRDKRLITADADKITRLELNVKQQSIEFSRDKQQWQIIKPKPLRADDAKVEALVRKLTDAKMDAGAGPDDKAAENFASGSAVAVARVTTETGTQQLEVRKQKEDYYAKSSVTDGVYKVLPDLGQALDQKLDDFRNKKLFDFGLSEPAKIEIHDGAKTYFLTSGGNDWWSADGKKFTKESAEALVEKLRELEAAEFAESGFGGGVLQITIASSDGRQVEKVSLAKGAGKTLARRDNDASLYVFDSSLIGDLEKLTAALKEETK